MIENSQCIISTPVCNLLIEASDSGITKISRTRANTKAKRTTATPKQTKIHKQASKALKGFFSGDATALDSLPYDLQGTQFQKKVWNALRKIPFGEVRSYSRIAQQVGSPKAARAVGSACGKNPVFLAVPCHRVIAADGGLGGFAGGIPLKQALLRFEEQQG